MPGDENYEGARSVWNGAIDRKPAVIACCTTAEQVADAIRFARGAGSRSRSAAAVTTTPATRSATAG